MAARMGGREHDMQTQHCPINTGKQLAPNEVNQHQIKLAPN